MFIIIVYVIYIVSVFMFTGKWNLCHMVFLLARRNLLKDLLYCCLGRFFLCYLRTNLYVCVDILLVYVFVHIFDMFSYSVRGCLIKGVKYITFILINYLFKWAAFWCKINFFFGTAHYAKYNTIQGVVSEFRPPSPLLNKIKCVHYINIFGRNFFCSAVQIANTNYSNCFWMQLLPRWSQINKPWFHSRIFYNVCVASFQ